MGAGGQKGEVFHIDDMLATLRYLLDAEQHIAPLTHLA